MRVSITRVYVELIGTVHTSGTSHRTAVTFLPVIESTNYFHSQCSLVDNAFLFCRLSILFGLQRVQFQWPTGFLLHTPNAPICLILQKGPVHGMGLNQNRGKQENSTGLTPGPKDNNLSVGLHGLIHHTLMSQKVTLCKLWFLLIPSRAFPPRKPGETPSTGRPCFSYNSALFTIALIALSYAYRIVVIIGRRCKYTLCWLHPRIICKVCLALDIVYLVISLFQVPIL